MIANYNMLKRRYSTHEHGQKMLEAQLHRTETSKNALDMEMNRLKPIIKSLQELKQQHARLEGKQWQTVLKYFTLICVFFELSFSL